MSDFCNVTINGENTLAKSLIKEICFKNIFDKYYISIESYEKSYDEVMETRVEFLDVSKDTLFINYETYDSVEIRKNIDTFIKCKKQIEEFINHSEIIESILGRKIEKFIFDNINIHVDIVEENKIISTNATSQECEKLFESKKFLFNNYVPRFICDGEPTFVSEFDKLEQLYKVLKTTKYLKECFWYYHKVEKNISHYNLVSKPWGNSIIILLESDEYGCSYCIGYIDKNFRYCYDFDLKEILKNS